MEWSNLNSVILILDSSCPTEGEEAHGCQNRVAAKLDTDVDFTPKALLERFKEVTTGVTASMSAGRKRASLGLLQCRQLPSLSTAAGLTRNQTRVQRECH